MFRAATQPGVARPWSAATGPADVGGALVTRSPMRELEGGDVVLAHYVGVEAMRSPRGVRVGVMRLRIGEPGGVEAVLMRGLVIEILARLTGGVGVVGCHVWVVGESNT